MWGKNQIEIHQETALLLDKITREAFDFIKRNQNIFEYEVANFILKRFKEENLEINPKEPIVGFRKNSAIPHYFPKEKTSQKIEKNSLVLIDIWARKKINHAPYADITWVGFTGKKVPKKIQKVFDTVILARDSALSFIQRELKQKRIPTGIEVNEKANEVIVKAGFKAYILHSTGHALGFTNPHGNPPHISRKSRSKLKINVGYTIEPGIYIPNAFGIRSEMNFFIDRKFKLHVTTPLQKKMVCI